MVDNENKAADDLDETRRLLYMALAAGRGVKRYNLGGTLINAIRHHQGVEDPDLEEKVLGQVEGTAVDEDWVRGQISRLTAELSADGA